MSFELPAFVDKHAHLLRTSSGTAPPWGDRAQVREFHDRCAAAGTTPVDALEHADRATLTDALERGLSDARALGLAEVWEAGVRDWAFVDALIELRERGPLPVRVRLLIAAGLAETGMRRRLGDAWCEMEGVKFYADGWLGTRTCAVSHAFRDEPDNNGHLFESASTLARRIEPFAKDGWTIATHAIGDRAIEAVLDAYELAFGGDVRAQEPRVEHAQVLRADLIARMAEMGVVACIQPGFAVDDRESAAAALQGEWPDAYRWSELLDAGVRVVTGSDFPIDDLSPLRGLQKLLTNPFDTISGEAALALMTDERAGSVVLSEDPLAVDPDRIGSIAVLSTTVNA